jgi:poly(ADP-ribose) glycohydrolase ARH3
LIGVAVGDALGAPFEGAGSVSDRAWRKVADAGDSLRFTDDTHMTFGVIEALLASEGFDEAMMAGIFMRNFEAEPWRGYGQGPPRVFARIREGVQWDRAARQLYGGEGSYGNGAAMRVAPIGLRFHWDLERLTDLARRSASITHAHRLGQEGAALQAAAVAHAVSWGPPLVPTRFLQKLREESRASEFEMALEKVESLVASEEPDAVAARIGNGISALQAVPAALAAFLSNADSFRDTIRFAIRMGGDTDTIASMAGALSGAYLGEEAIPAVWRSRTEGARSMERLGGILFDHASAERHEP